MSQSFTLISVSACVFLHLPDYPDLNRLSRNSKTTNPAGLAGFVVPPVGGLFLSDFVRLAKFANGKFRPAGRGRHPGLGALLLVEIAGVGHVVINVV